MNELFRALPKLLKEFDDNEELREAVTLAAWRKIAGESLLKHAVPFRLFNKHLIVAVRDNMWKRHLETLSGQMIFKINSVLGQAIVTGSNSDAVLHSCLSATDLESFRTKFPAYLDADKFEII